MRGTFKINRLQLRQILKTAALAAKKRGTEICGLLVDNGLFLEVFPLENASRKGGSFCFFPAEVRRVQKAVESLGREIVGTFHSHPMGTAEPGVSDVLNAVDDSLMLVIDVSDQEAKLWHILRKKARRVRLNLC